MMFKNNTNISAEELKALIDTVDTADKMSKEDMFAPEKVIAEIVKNLKEQGVPDEINAPIAAIMLGRFRERRLMADIAKKLIPIQELPPGALPIYYRKPEDEE